MKIDPYYQLSGFVYRAKSCTSAFLAGKFPWGHWKCKKGEAKCTALQTDGQTDGRTT